MWKTTALYEAVLQSISAIKSHFRQWINKSTVGPSRLSVLDNPARTNNSIHWRTFMPLYDEESKCRTQTCLLFWAISSVQLFTVKPTLAVSAKKRTYILNDTRIKACLRRFDGNVYTTLDFWKRWATPREYTAAICIPNQRIRTATHRTHWTKQALTLAPRPSTWLIPRRRTTVRCVW